MSAKYLFFFFFFFPAFCLAQVNPLDKNGNLKPGYFFFNMDYCALLNINSDKKIWLDSADRTTDREYTDSFDTLTIHIEERVSFYDSLQIEIREYQTGWWQYEGEQVYRQYLNYLEDKKLRNYISIRGQKFYLDSIFHSDGKGLPVNTRLILTSCLVLPSHTYLLGVVEYEHQPNTTQFSKFYVYAIFDITSNPVVLIRAPSDTQSFSDSVIDDFNGDGVLDFLSFEYDRIHFYTLNDEQWIKNPDFYMGVKHIGDVIYQFDLKHSRWFKKLELVR